MTVNRFDFLFDPATRLADQLLALAGPALRQAQVEAVNEVTTRFDRLARAGQNEGINLTDEYIRSKTKVDLATSDPKATITTRGDLTVMGRFPRTQRTRPATSGRAKGDPSRGIPAGQKADGLTLEIAKGRARVEPRLFTMTLKNGNGVGVFVRTSAGKKKHLYGPSPYSLFRYQVQRRRDDLMKDLQQTGLDRISRIVSEGLR